MRIAVDARPLAHPNTGIGRYTTALLKRMMDLDADHKWYLYCDRPLNRLWRERPGVTIRVGNADGWMGRLWCSQVQFAWWARRDRIDTFWSPRHHLPKFLPRKQRAVVTIHDLVWLRFPDTMMADNLKAESTLMPAALDRANEIIAVSAFTAGELASEFPDAVPATVIHEAGFDQVDPARLPETAVPEGAPYFLFVGTLEPRKNLLVLLNAFAELVHKRTLSTRLVIVGGKGWGDQNVSGWVKELGLEDVVVQMGVVSRNQLQVVYEDALSLVMPSLYEGFGLPVVEAMEKRVPVIASDRGSLPEIVADGGVLIDLDKEHNLADAMEAMVVDGEHREALAGLAEQRAGAFSWDTAAEQTLAILEGDHPNTGRKRR